MTVDEARARDAKLGADKAKGDPEVHHADLDDFVEELLRAIVECPYDGNECAGKECRALAAIGLEAFEVVSTRWCA